LNIEINFHILVTGIAIGCWSQ